MVILDVIFVISVLVLYVCIVMFVYVFVNNIARYNVCSVVCVS